MFLHISLRKEILYFLIGISLCASDSGSSFWSYTDPNLWPYIESLGACGSTRQSPINITNENIRCNSSIIKPLKLINYGSLTLNFSYNGKAINAFPLEETNIAINGSGLPISLQPFEFAQFHFHWGNTSQTGSEHLIGGVGFPLEIHFVHVSKVNPAYYAVIGVLFEIQNDPNPRLNEIIASVDHLSNNVDQSKITTINLRSILPDSLDKFYFYEGSLTTPPCTESVFWTVMENKIGISETQMASFRTNILSPNVRPIQPVNNRVVLTNFCEEIVNKASVLNCQFINSKLFLSSILVILLFI